VIVDLNPYVRLLVETLSAATGIVVGSERWLLGGHTGWGAATGANKWLHSAYGWDHASRLESGEVEPAAVVLNFAARPSVGFLGAPLRWATQAEAGMPLAFDANGKEIPISDPAAYYGGYPVWGLELEHAWIEPLVAVVRQGGPYAEAAKTFLRLTVASIVGQLRHPYIMAGHPGTDRGVAVPVYAVTRAAEVGCVDDADLEHFAAWLTKVVIPKKPTFHVFPPQVNEPLPFALIGQTAWSSAALDYAARVFKAYPAFEPEKLESLAISQAHSVAACVRADGSLPWVVPVVAGVLSTDDAHGYDVGDWGYRCLTIAGYDDLAAKVLSRFKSKVESEVWLVNADGTKAV
jgi:hypothetical protein